MSFVVVRLYLVWLSNVHVSLLRSTYYHLIFILQTSGLFISHLASRIASPLHHTCFLYFQRMPCILRKAFDLTHWRRNDHHFDTANYHNYHCFVAYCLAWTSLAIHTNSWKIGIDSNDRNRWRLDRSKWAQVIPQEIDYVNVKSIPGFQSFDLSANSYWQLHHRSSSPTTPHIKLFMVQFLILMLVFCPLYRLDMTGIATRSPVYAF
jgi:hypothetical protein